MKVRQKPLNIVVCGVGGQGNILISRLIGRILTDQGYTVSIGETFGAAQRGGSVFSCLRVSKERLYGPIIPEGQANVIISLEPILAESEGTARRFPRDPELYDRWNRGKTETFVKTCVAAGTA